MVNLFINNEPSSISEKISQTIDSYGSYGVDLLKEMIVYDTTSSDESVGSNQGFVNYMAEELESQGFSVETLDVTREYQGKPVTYTTILATTENGDGPHYVLNGHYDVAADGNEWDKFIPKETTIERDGKETDIVYGKGTSDMKGGLISHILAAKALKDTGSIHGKVTLMLVPDEEVGGQHGTNYALNELVINRGENIDGAVITESTNGRVVTKRRAMGDYAIEYDHKLASISSTVESYSIEKESETGHTAIRTRDKPHALYDLADSLETLSQDMKLYFTSMKGGSAQNTSPASVESVVSVEIENKIAFEKYLDDHNIVYERIEAQTQYIPAISQLIKDISNLRKVDFPALEGSRFGTCVGPNIVQIDENYGRLNLDIRILQPNGDKIDKVVYDVFSKTKNVTKEREATCLAQDGTSPWVATLTEKAQREIYWEDDVASGENPGQSDSRYFVDYGRRSGKDIPVCEIGPTGTNVHSKNEYIVLETIAPVAKVIALSIAELMGK